MTIDVSRQKLFFTADEHYGHDNIIQHCNRPFKDSSQMDKCLIEKHNQTVSPKDLVIHIGDFSFKKTVAENVLPQLNGRHIFVTGNHDQGWLLQWQQNNVKQVFDVLDLKITGDEENKYITCCHYPMRSWNKSFYGSWQLYGHCHGNIEPEGLQMDVGVDCHEYGPVSYEMVKMAMEEKSKHISNFNVKDN